MVSARTDGTGPADRSNCFASPQVITDPNIKQEPGLKPADVFLGRQAIVDRYRNVIAYELLFRAGPDGCARVTDHSMATATVIANAFDTLGIQTVVGDCRAFINVDGPTLMSEAIETLPQQRVVIELLETIRVSDEIVRRCRELKAQGYRLALDDFSVYGEEYEPLLDVVDIVKVDTLMLEPASLANLVARLKMWPLRLLAEKVDCKQRATDCLALGFNLFQGFFFGRPVTLAA
ncbi:EAL domain-containing protein [Aromatoleum petrolei]|uniref:EAL domain-containing protein n=2 Tax=Aromatoleum petrolei TaxID=76116 RepID=A0ABX1MN45_9RHOO|nr:EAL domain-containing protein [Aromatoleum petrolei]